MTRKQYRKKMSGQWGSGVDGWEIDEGNCHEVYIYQTQAIRWNW